MLAVEKRSQAIGPDRHIIYYGQEKEERRGESWRGDHARKMFDKMRTWEAAGECTKWRLILCVGFDT